MNWPLASTSEEDLVADFRATVLADFAPGVPDGGPVALEGPLPAFATEAVIDIDAQTPGRLAPEELERWAARADVTLVGVASWALALGAPHDNAALRWTFARESDLAQVRSWTAEVPALAEARRRIEVGLAPWLPLGSTRRALVHIRRGRDAAATAAVVADLAARRAALAGTIDSAAIARWIPRVRALAAALHTAAAADFRAWALLAKLGHAAACNHVQLELGPLMPDAAAAAEVEDLLSKLQRDRALFEFAFFATSDPALEPLATYRGVRIDEFAVSMLLRRHGHPGYQGT